LLSIYLYWRGCYDNGAAVQLRSLYAARPLTQGGRMAGNKAVESEFDHSSD